MARSRIITGLDVGTSSIKALAAERHGNEWNVVSYAQVPSFGLRRGVVVSVEDTARNIQLLLQRIEKESGRRIGSVFVNINGSHLRVEPSDGLISVSRADHVISQEDVERVLQATKSINISSNEDILEVFPREFIIDDQKEIQHPLGLTGVRLQAKVLLLCYFQSHFTNLTQAVLNSRVQIDDVVPSPIAAARAVLTPQQKEIGVALIDMGASTTSLAVFEEGDLVHLAVFPLGSANITNDLAIGLKTEVSIAEDIKKQYGSCILGGSPQKTSVIKKPGMGREKNGEISTINVTVKNGEITDHAHGLSFTRKRLVDIIEPRVSEILDLIQKELKKIGRQELLPGGVVLTGGGVKLPQFKELVRQQLKLPCEIGSPKGIVGFGDDPMLATVAGLVLGDQESGGSAGEGMSGFLKSMMPGFKKMFRVFIP
jgi:cell division protein FtsA